MIWPLAVAGVLAYLLDPVVDFLQRANASACHVPSFWFSSWRCSLVIVGLLASIVPRLVVETRELGRKIPGPLETFGKKGVERSVCPPPC